MGSLRIDLLREKYPGMTDVEIAGSIALKEGYSTIVRYKSIPEREYNSFGCCMTDKEVIGYFTSSACHEVEIIYDRHMRSTDAIRELVREQLLRARGRIK
jgi:hypothetical protein